MLSRKYRLILIAGAVLACGINSVLRAQVSADGEFVALFDGKTLDGWQKVGDAQWQVVDGTILTAGDKPGFLMTTREFADFELRVEYRAPAATNSGIFLRTALRPTDPTKDCYELNIAPAENPFPTGSLVGKKKVVLAVDRFPAANQWHSLDVKADGGKFKIRLGGSLVLEYEDPEPIRRGQIGLQANSGEVAFRNIRIRELRDE